MTEDLKLSGYSPSTTRIYLHYCQYFAKHFMRSPAEMGEKEIRSFLLHLLIERDLSHESYRQCYAALKFLYMVTLKRPFEVESIPRHKKPHLLPNILSGSEIVSLFSAFTHLKYRTVAMTIYGAGLRISESCRLCVKDIDSKRMLIHVRQGKGNRDRYVMLSKRLLKALREWWKVARPLNFLFEAARGKSSPMSDTAFRNALRRAARKAGIQKRVTSHLLRHCFATHLMEIGTDVATIQFLLGHRRIEATARYTHVSTRRIQQVLSPLDILETPKGFVLG
jgi:site-specific recombinase XerD